MNRDETAAAAPRPCAWWCESHDSPPRPCCCTDHVDSDFAVDEMLRAPETLP